MLRIILRGNFTPKLKFQFFFSTSIFPKFSSSLLNEQIKPSNTAKVWENHSFANDQILNQLLKLSIIDMNEYRQFGKKTLLISKNSVIFNQVIAPRLLSEKFTLTGLTNLIVILIKIKEAVDISHYGKFC